MDIHMMYGLEGEGKWSVLGIWYSSSNNTFVSRLAIYPCASATRRAACSERGELYMDIHMMYGLEGEGKWSVLGIWYSSSNNTLVSRLAISLSVCLSD
jgi:hypothetical protein